MLMSLDKTKNPPKIRWVLKSLKKLTNYSFGKLLAY